MNKLTYTFQNQFKDNLIFDNTIFNNIDPAVKLHDETQRHPLSSAAACLNVLGSMMNKPEDLKAYLNQFGLEIEELLPFPSGCVVGERKYEDKGYVVFEWVGPKKSPINEPSGGRGFNRTSVDAFILAKIHGKVTQLLIEWKFTEGISRPIALNRFAGLKGNERLRRYTSILAGLRKSKELPFQFEEEGGIGTADFSADHIYQLFRMTLLAKKTTPIKIGNLLVEDYRMVHFSHSLNDEVNIVHPKYLESSPGFTQFSGATLYEMWSAILSHTDKPKFVHGHWDKAIESMSDSKLKSYLSERYA